LHLLIHRNNIEKSNVIKWNVYEIINDKKKSTPQKATSNWIYAKTRQFSFQNGASNILGEFLNVDGL